MVYGVSKVFNWSGTAIRGSLDMYDGNYGDATKSLGSVVIFETLGTVGQIAQLTKGQQYLWNIILSPYNNIFNNLIE